MDAPPPVVEMERIDLTTRNIEDTPMVEPKAIQLSSYKTRSEKLMDFRKATLDATDGRVEIYPIDGNFVPEDFKAHETPEIGAPVRRDISSAGVDVYEVGQLDQSGPSYQFDDMAPISPAQIPVRREAVQPRPQNVPTVFFGHNATGLGADDLEVIKAAAQFYRSNPSARFSLEGYASMRSAIQDMNKRKLDNFDLASRRIVETAKALVAHGVSPDAIKGVIWGEDNAPAMQAGGKSAEEMARRVEIIAVSVQ